MSTLLKCNLLFSLVFSFSIQIMSQEMNPEIIVQQQLEAYNARDLEKFAACYTTDIKIYNFQETEPSIEGLEKLKSVYKDVFERSPDLEAKIDKRIVFDNKVIDHEKVTGRKGVVFIEVIAIYEVRDNLISKVTFIRKEK